jgi:hypothetical protein
VTTWRKSTHSGSNGSDCVEVGGSPAVLVRDTKNRSGAILSFGPDQWRRFTTAIKDTDKT